MNTVETSEECTRKTPKPPAKLLYIYIYIYLFFYYVYIYIYITIYIYIYMCMLDNTYNVIWVQTSRTWPHDLILNNIVLLTNPPTLKPAISVPAWEAKEGSESIWKLWRTYTKHHKITQTHKNDWQRFEMYWKILNKQCKVLREHWTAFDKHRTSIEKHSQAL